MIVAGDVSTLPEERECFHDEVEPHIDGDLVSHIRPIHDGQKTALLGGAAALLLPVEWERPFPVVLPALLCGTRVIGFRRSGVPEGIDDGRTGFLCDTLEEMAAAVARLREIDRGVCRLEPERRFSTQAVAGEYETLYKAMAA